MVYEGLVVPGNKTAFDTRSPGWGNVMEAIGRETVQI
jgi:hypothetical protein